MSEQPLTLDYFTGRVDQVRKAIEKAIEEAGAYGSDQLMTDLEWTQYVHDHVHVSDEGDNRVVDDPGTTAHLDELVERYRVH
ncbi:hypothetical protein ACNHUS_09860 [Actinomycetes bacterium M1A6_2h]